MWNHTLSCSSIFSVTLEMSLSYRLKFMQISLWLNSYQYMYIDKFMYLCSLYSVHMSDGENHENYTSSKINDFTVIQLPKFKILTIQQEKFRYKLAANLLTGFHIYTLYTCKTYHILVIFSSLSLSFKLIFHSN